MTSNEKFNEIKTDVALIKNDLKNLSENLKIITNISKTLAVQENMLSTDNVRMNKLETEVLALEETNARLQKEFIQYIDKRNDELLDNIREMNKSFSDKQEILEKKINRHDNLFNYLFGAAFVVGFIIGKTPILTMLFGG